MKRITNHKCNGCGIFYNDEILTRYPDGNYCKLCELDIEIIEQQKQAQLILPSYFLSTKHYNIFNNELAFFHPDEFKNTNIIISAYILSIPAINDFLSQKKNKHLRDGHPIYHEFPFLWQYNYLLIERTNNRLVDYEVNNTVTLIIKRNLDGSFSQNKNLINLSIDCQAMLYLAHILTTQCMLQTTIVTEPFLRKIYPTLTPSFQKLFDEAVFFFEKYQYMK